MDKSEENGRDVPRMSLEKDIQHHVRNPLQAITVLIEGIRLECHCESKINPYLQRIKRQIAILSTYLDSLPAKFQEFDDDE